MDIKSSTKFKVVQELVMYIYMNKLTVLKKKNVHNVFDQLQYSHHRRC